MSLDIISQIFQRYADQGDISGACFTVFQGNKTLCKKAVGYADVNKAFPLKENALSSTGLWVIIT